MSILLKILFWQVVVAAIVTGILKMVLDKNLIASAIKQFERICQHLDPPSSLDVVVVTCRPLAKSVSEHLSQIVRNKFGETAVVRYQIDKLMWGGIIIRVDRTVINYSLKDRLRQAFGK